MNYYNKKYYEWQRKAGEYGAQQDFWMYTQFIKSDDRVLDFGCGGGDMLEKIICRSKYGVDINPLARKEAGKKGIKVYPGLDDIPTGLKFDIIYSHHTLEHLENPAEILRSLKKYLKKDSKLIVVVPIDDWRIEKKYEKNEVNQHFYTWTPRLLGNLFSHCGYKIQEIKIIERAWIPFSRFYYLYMPKLVYNFFSMLWSKITLSRQIRVRVELGNVAKSI